MKQERDVGFSVGLPSGFGVADRDATSARIAGSSISSFTSNGSWGILLMVTRLIL